MNTVTPQERESFAAELVHRGLPIDFACRVAEELADHQRDLVDELRASGLAESAATAEASRRLGDTREIVNKTVREYRRRYWCGRWPLLAFLIGPPVLVVMSFVAIVLVAYAIFIPLEYLGIRFDQSAPDGIVSSGEYAAALVGRVLTLFVGPAVSLMVLGYFARRAAVGPAWICLSTTIMTLTVSCMWCGLAGGVRPSFPADQGITMVGLPILRFAHDPMYIAQCLLPLGIGAGMILRMRRHSRRAELMMLEVHTQGGIHEYAKCA
jgi:hypothetical protein